jgi:hypothetical protein
MRPRRRASLKATESKFAGRRLWHSIKCNAQVARCSRHPRREGQGRRENGRDIIRWCFADLVTAALFQKEFGEGQRE